MANNDKGVTGVLMDEQKTPRLLFTVLMANGGRTIHTYKVPSDRDEALNFVGTMIDMIADALTRKTDRCLAFMNPSICYNPDHVLGVEFKAVGEDELDEAGKKALNKRIGLIKD